MILMSLTSYVCPLASELCLRFDQIEIMLIAPLPPLALDFPSPTGSAFAGVKILRRVEGQRRREDHLKGMEPVSLLS